MFATSAVRHAPNRDEVLQSVSSRSGRRTWLLPGELEAELTFLAARRWMGWRCGPLAVFDIGGGSLEVAFGRGKTPEFAASLPLGANRLTRDFFGAQDPPSAAALKALRRKTRQQLRGVSARIRWESPRTVAATSRIFQQLARLCGAAPEHDGPFVERVLRRADLRRAVKEMADMSAAQRADLPGISTSRAGQSLAGAVVGHTAMKLGGIDSVVICPWAVREGLLLRCIEDGPDWLAPLIAERSSGSGSDRGSSSNGR